MNRKVFALLSVSLAAASPVPACARAGELFGGAYAHAVETPLSLGTGEGGADIELGYRAEPIGALKDLGSPAPYAFVSVNTGGGTDFIAAGLAWKVDLGPVYVRPGLGLSLNNGPERRVDANGTRTDLGSRVLFEPELGLGVELGRGASLEASWVHISGARLFNGQQNPGVDMIGVRFNQRI
jgi:lipid A 3-O-deacylase